MMLRALATAAAISLSGNVWAEPQVQILGFGDLTGWQAGDHGPALSAFASSCDLIDDPDWPAICAMAQTVPPENAKGFFELLFRPVLIEDGTPGLFTGYFEPELRGSRYRSPAYPYPVYRLPPEAQNGPWLSRREIEETNILADRGLEIAFVEDPVDLFFLQIQGSGRIRLDDGGVIRVGYAGSNGRRYSSVGERLIQRNIYKPHQVSAQVIRNWVRRNPAAGLDLLRENESYVFFRVISDLPADKGPIGAMTRPLTNMRSIAVDPAYTPLGAPVWIEKEGATPLQQLMVAQDTGSAIKGAQRVDIFHGTGAKAGRAAAHVRDTGRMVVLLPIQRAYALMPERLH